VNPTSETAAEHRREVEQGRRFEFGANWSRFLHVLDEQRILTAQESLSEMLGTKSLQAKTFLDVGSGSGLFSLAARRLGARVHSFDFDTNSVACTKELHQRYFPDDAEWRVEQASVLDLAYLKTLGEFDVVYSWGVLHHTGQMWKALDNVARLVAPGGLLFIAIYNDQGTKSNRWHKWKQLYNKSGPLKPVIAGSTGVVLWWRRWVQDLLKFRPFASWRAVREERGMSAWRDVVDWVGGYPFEVATPEKIFDFYRERGFTMTRLVTTGGSLGCNQFVFRK
jgi:2-polyprenyl-3-methyl-5-hydroxy-6-metoxy-1,4-benzoquinol methylase